MIPVIVSQKRSWRSWPASFASGEAFAPPRCDLQDLSMLQWRRPPACCSPDSRLQWEHPLLTEKREAWWGSWWMPSRSNLVSKTRYLWWSQESHWISEPIPPNGPIHSSKRAKALKTRRSDCPSWSLTRLALASSTNERKKSEIRGISWESVPLPFAEWQFWQCLTYI